VELACTHGEVGGEGEDLTAVVPGKDLSVLEEADVVADAYTYVAELSFEDSELGLAFAHEV
jgi:hypothetical protein